MSDERFAESDVRVEALAVAPPPPYAALSWEWAHRLVATATDIALVVGPVLVRHARQQFEFNKVMRWVLAVPLVAGTSTFVADDGGHVLPPPIQMAAAVPAAAPKPVATSAAPVIAGPRVRVICSLDGRTVAAEDRSEAAASSLWKDEVVARAGRGAVCTFTHRTGNETDDDSDFVAPDVAAAIARGPAAAPGGGDQLNQALAALEAPAGSPLRSIVSPPVPAQPARRSVWDGSAPALTPPVADGGGLDLFDATVGGIAADDLMGRMKSATASVNAGASGPASVFGSAATAPAGSVKNSRTTDVEKSALATAFALRELRADVTAMQPVGSFPLQTSSKPAVAPAAPEWSGEPVPWMDAAAVGRYGTTASEDYGMDYASRLRLIERSLADWAATQTWARPTAAVTPAVRHRGALTAQARGSFGTDRFAGP